MALRSTLVASAAAALLSACAVGPDYVRPPMDVPAAFKEAGPWTTATPMAVDNRQWWQAYDDPTLDALMVDAERANQNIRQAEAQYREARAVVDADRAGLFPTIGVQAGAERARSTTNGLHTGNAFTLGGTGSWEPDLWGSVRRTIESGVASAQASADDLAAARLSIQTTLAQDYLQLRITDQQRALYADTIKAYTTALKLTQAQHAAGVALLSDVALAQSQLTTAQAAGVDLDATRATLEHAIAILTGRAPAQFSLAPVATFGVQVPATPAGLPSDLLQRRPDIAGAERRAAAANANIGVARAAFFPSLTLSASGGFGATAIDNLFDTPGRVWSLGAALAETIFDGGLRKAHDAQAVAAYDVTVAQYKETVLGGFQQVEDELATLRVLDQETVFQTQAVSSAQLAERLALAQYRAGTTSYLNVVTAQQLALTNERAAVQLRGRQLAASVTLVTAIGGGWNAADPPLAANAAAPAASASAPASASVQEPTT